ncbi:MAG: (2Fe-2S)-binding protein [Thermodesulfobacteriota bacterium]
MAAAAEPEADDDLIICRCEEISKGEIKEAIRSGLVTLNGIKRVTRAGMGLCQGQTCGRLVTQVVCRELGLSPAEVEPATARAPVRPVRLSVLATG